MALRRGKKGTVFELTDTFYGNDVKTWLFALGVAIGTFLVLRLIEQVLIVRVESLTKKTDTVIDDILIHALRKTKLGFLTVVSIFAGSALLTLPDKVRSILWSVTIIATLLQGGIWISAALLMWLQKYREKQLSSDAASVMTMNMLGRLARIVLWSVILLLILDNLGVDVTALVAGLGIGGIAVALAAQNILGDLFASLAIVLDKPFVLGDFVIVGDLLGTVQRIGIKTTRITSLSGEQLVFSNADLLGSRIRNFGRMRQRRIVFTLGVTYDTPSDKLEKIPVIIQEVIDGQEKCRFDRSHFSSYGDFSLNFESVYYVELADYNVYMDIQQAINLGIYRRFEAEGIEFAFPTQTLFVQKQAG